MRDTRSAPSVSYRVCIHYSKVLNGPGRERRTTDFKALIEKIRNIHILVEIDKLLQASEEVFPSSAGQLQFGRFGANAIS